jgi:hypothetical protein
MPADPTPPRGPAEPPEQAIQEPRVPANGRPAEPPPEPMSESGPDGWTNWRAQRNGAHSAGAVEYAGYTDAQLLEDQVDLGPCRLLNTIGFAARQPGQVPLSLVLRVEWYVAADARERSRGGDRHVGMAWRRCRR